ncbi:gamma-glutamyltransferase family protein [Mariprofundus ferrooxydans]|uniref:Gamma-glutamyltranspeptidase n=1 Tax=Mariprofundus ferrooxydans PV-1 TaxID=314345 RepID=Q0F0B6_9PROT|nr:gamma-glutamyltransferase [Mariprofundus ferrooxydans]EAU55112.1 Gamma-glutamyltranspeptidase [Mariprofundus ferrooxydans PV-1]KON46850.1 gamma-glutamyltranspeptidase [Mariprofundus ferrooxydans]
MRRSVRTTGARRGAVAAGHPATAEAGAAILRMGGNAVDAAIAAVTTSFTAEPVLTSAGGGGFMLIAGSSKPILYDGFARMPSGRMPAGVQSELKSTPIDFGDSVQHFHIGQGSVAAPSLLAMLFETHRQHGCLPLAEAIAPGMDAARSGIRLNDLQASFIQLLRPILTDTTDCTALYAPHGQLLQAGDTFHNKALANTLEMLLLEGIDEMYHGDLARAIVRSCMPYGLLGMDDMRAKQVQARRPLSIPLFGGRLLSNPPPSSGGLLIAFAATLLDQLKGEAEAPALLAECLRAASQLRCEYFDARIYDDNIDNQILAPEQIQQASSTIRHRLRNGETPTDSTTEAGNRLGSTTHISIVDGDGMVVSVTTSNGEGAGIVVPDSGIHLNNILGEADINPFGFHTLPAGRSLSSMMAPSVFIKNGRPSIVLGSGGSNRLRGAILQVLSRHLLLGESMEAAVHAPRLHNENMVLDAEPACFNDAQRQQLISLGWSIRDWRQTSIYFGGVHAIAIDAHGHLQAAGDPRRGGTTAFT